MRPIIIGTFLLASASCQAQDFPSAEDRWARFKLYTACAPVGLLVVDLPSGAADIGLTEQEITTTIRSRLRGARIYSSEQDSVPYLYVQVSVLKLPFIISFQLAKAMLDLETELVFPAVSWQNGTGGTHGGDGVDWIPRVH